MQKNNITALEVKDIDDLQKEMIEDASDLARDDSCGKVIGYAVIAIYEDGHNARIEVPEGEDNYFIFQTNKIIEEAVEEQYEEETEEYEL